jgi:hypothetical protein
MYLTVTCNVLSIPFYFRVTFVQNFWTVWPNLTVPQRITVMRKPQELRQIEMTEVATRNPNETIPTSLHTNPILKSLMQARDAMMAQEGSISNASNSASGQSMQDMNGDGAWNHFRKMWIAFLNYFGL